MADLNRFLLAQQEVFTQALAELSAGRKRTHWMWFIFPQLAGLGRSETAQYYAVQNLEETKQYLEHPVLGTRLKEITEAVLNLPAHITAEAIFGYPDYLKFHSCLTLFNIAAGDKDSIFEKALIRFYNREGDKRTMEILREQE